MNAVARYALTDTYFRESYGEWSRHIAKWRRWAPVVVCLLLAAGVVSAFVGFTHAAAVAFTAAIAETGELMWHRSRWLRARRDSRRSDENVELTFTDQGISARGPNSISELTWAAIQSAKATSKGLFLIPQKGAHIYIPNGALDPTSAKADIVARVGG